MFAALLTVVAARRPSRAKSKSHAEFLQSKNCDAIVLTARGHVNKDADAKEIREAIGVYDLNAENSKSGQPYFSKSLRKFSTYFYCTFHCFLF
jgi:hypothetical protein